MSSCGDVVNDSHAEVIARRALLKFIYCQIQDCLLIERSSKLGTLNQGSYVLEWDAEKRGFKICANTHLHLYISQLPCGDVSIRSNTYDEAMDVKQWQDSSTVDSTFTWNTCINSFTEKAVVQEGILRFQDAVSGKLPFSTSHPEKAAVEFCRPVKVADWKETHIAGQSGPSCTVEEHQSTINVCGKKGRRSTGSGDLSSSSTDIRSSDGAKFAAEVSVKAGTQVGLVRRKPGRGDTTLSMSCSDKIALWNLLGVQGSLLSGLLTEPLYLNSITIGMSNSLLRQKMSAIIEEGVLECNASVSSCMKIRQETKQFLISLQKSLYERLHPYSSEVLAPFRLSLPNFFAAPCQPKEVGVHADEAKRLTCGYSIVWNVSGLHEVILGTTGRKQGTSKNGALSSATQSCISRKALMQLYISIQAHLFPDEDFTKYSYRELKQRSTLYCNTKRRIFSSPPFARWHMKPSRFQTFLSEQKSFSS